MERFRETGEIEIADGEFITFEIAELFSRPDKEVVFSWLDGRTYSAMILVCDPSYENRCSVESRLHWDMMLAKVDFIVVTGRTLPSDIARWYTIGDYVERVGQWLSFSSLAMNGLKHPRAALSLAVGGCAFWGVHNRWWNAVKAANYELEPCSFDDKLSRLLKDKAVLKKKKPRSKIFNTSTVLTACATAVAAGVILWARQKF